MFKSTSTPLKTKVCFKCKEEKLRLEFYRMSKAADGLNSYCKQCSNNAAHISHTSPKGKAYERQYDASETRRLQRQTPRAKELTRKRAVRKRKNKPLEHKARGAISKAVAAGKLPPASTLACQCGKPAQQYHHPSYKIADWLKVIALCIPCHVKVHKDSK